MRDNAQLWFNSIDELIGFAISENGKAEFYALVKKGHEFLFGEIIEWVKANWSNKKGVLSTNIDESLGFYATNAFQITKKSLIST